MTEAVTVVLRERLARERSRRQSDADLPERLSAMAERMRDAYDTRPVTKKEWDAAAGDEGCSLSTRQPLSQFSLESQPRPP